MKHLILCLSLASGVFFTGCIKEVPTSNAITDENIVSTRENLQSAVNGGYSLFKDHLPFNGQADDNLMYLRQYFQMSDFASDDIVCGQVTEDPLFYSFTYDHTSLQTNSRYFWYVSYKIISGMNTVIAAMEDQSDVDAASSQLLGECYFLRAFAHFTLSKYYARPYTIEAEAPGIVLRQSIEDPSLKPRSSVKEVYEAVIADALKGAELMNAPRGNIYASKEAAYALLSRVYLYRGELDSTIYYSTKVIESGRFSLETAATYPQLFANAKSAGETIFCIGFTPKEDYGKFGSIASMIYSDGNSGWGEEFASESLRSVLREHPEDVRNSYVVPAMDENGNVGKLNGIDMYYITKFSFQDGSPTLSSPILFRLAEMYLNRAEGFAKKGDAANALKDIDEIRRNRGLQASLYNGTLPPNMDLLDVVLKERRLELAFEGHRVFDIFRNKRDLKREYWGYHIPGLKETDINDAVKPVNYRNTLISWQNPKIIYQIPIDEIETNPAVIQNP